MNCRQLRRGAFAAAMMMLGVVGLADGPAIAAPVQLINNGPSTNRVDLVILGDGYRKNQMKKFAKDAQAFVDKFFTYTPFKDYARSFNVWRLDTPSSSAGANHNGQPGNTVYGAYYGCFSIERLLCIVEARVQQALTNFGAAQQDMVLVLVNDDEYGGSGGPYSVASTNEFSGDIAVHEFGHSFGHLDDEYVDQPNCGRYTNPWGFNVTQQTSRPNIPWQKWIDKKTPIPTKSGDKVGLFEGAYFCAKGWYRPTMSSMMLALGAPFREVNGEQLIRRIYETMSPIDSATPLARNVKIAAGKKKTFKVNVSNADISTFKITWRLDGTVISTSARLVLNGSDLSATPKTLQLTVKDATKMVRSDPSNLLIDQVTWQITRGP
jgi:hypothetical protein